MANLNDLTIVGHVGRDAEMKFTPAGKPVTNFSVAVSDRRGEETVTQWFEVTTWENLAERCNEYVTKGMQILVQGRVNIEKWVGNDNVNRARLAVNASRVLFLSPKTSE